MIWVAQKNDKLNWLLLWYNFDLNGSMLLLQYFFLSAVAVDVHLLSLMFSFYAFQRFIYSFINSYLILIFHWTRGCVFFKRVFWGGRVFGSFSVCLYPVCFVFSDHSVFADVENVSLFFISPLSFRSLLQKQMQHCRVKLHRIHWEINAFISLQNQKKTARRLFCIATLYFVSPQILIYNATK